MVRIAVTISFRFLNELGLMKNRWRCDFRGLFWLGVLAVWDEPDSKDFDSAAEEVHLWQQKQVLRQASIGGGCAPAAQRQSRF